jgi:hypothetical protein
VVALPLALRSRSVRENPIFTGESRRLLGGIPILKIPKEKIISISAALDLACTNITMCQNNKKLDDSLGVAAMKEHRQLDR